MKLWPSLVVFAVIFPILCVPLMADEDKKEAAPSEKKPTLREAPVVKKTPEGGRRAVRRVGGDRENRPKPRSGRRGLFNRLRKDGEAAPEEPQSRAEQEAEKYKALNFVRGRVSKLQGDELTVEVGKNQGVVEGTAVIALEGLVGVAREVEAGSCKVRLVSHPESLIPIRVEHTLATASLRGAGNGKVKLEALKLGDDVKKENWLIWRRLLTTPPELPPNFLAGNIVGSDNPEDGDGWETQVTVAPEKLKSVMFLKLAEP